MDIKNIASIKGESGLVTIMKTHRSGEIIVRPLDKKRMGVTMVVPAHKATLLGETSIYTNDDNERVPLQDIFSTIWKKFGTNFLLKTDSEPQKLKSFMKEILPEYDEQKVYISDIRKIVKWYGILLQHAPEIVKSEISSAQKEEKTADKTTQIKE